MRTGPISVNELKNAFFSIKTNQCEIHNKFEQNNFTLGVFYDQSKTSDTVDYNKLHKN